MSLLDTVDALQLDVVKAKELHRLYRQHRAAQTPEDQQIEKAYREIARGKVIIRAFASIRAAGRFDDGLPKLALIRADARLTHCYTQRDSVTFSLAEVRWGRATGTRRGVITVDGMPHPNGALLDGRATVPLIPVHLRPKHHLRNYHVLWEADWHRVPHDPLLLRKLTGDMWIVLAAWDLTDVERAALEQRVSA